MEVTQKWPDFFLLNLYNELCNASGTICRLFQSYHYVNVMLVSCKQKEPNQMAQILTCVWEDGAFVTAISDLTGSTLPRTATVRPRITESTPMSLQNAYWLLVATAKCAKLHNRFHCTMTLALQGQGQQSIS